MGIARTPAFFRRRTNVAWTARVRHTRERRLANGKVSNVIYRDRSFVLIAKRNCANVPYGVFPNVLMVRQRLGAKIACNADLSVRDQPATSERLQIRYLIRDLNVMVYRIRFGILRRARIRASFPEVNAFEFRVMRQVLNHSAPLTKA